MSLLSDVVGIAHEVTHGLGFQCQVTFERYTGGDGTHGSSYAAPVLLLAVVDWQESEVRTESGITRVKRPRLTFLDRPALAAATPASVTPTGVSIKAGIQTKDKITLPDGTTGPTQNLGGFIDTETGQPCATEVTLG